MEHESDGDTNCNWCTRFGHQGLVQALEDLEIRGPEETPLNYRIVEIGQNTKKSPRDLRRVADTQTQAENHQLTLV